MIKQLVLAGAAALTVLGGVMIPTGGQVEAAERVIDSTVMLAEGKCIRKGVRLSDDGRSLVLDPSCKGPERAR